MLKPLKMLSLLLTQVFNVSRSQSIISFRSIKIFQVIYDERRCTYRNKMSKFNSRVVNNQGINQTFESPSVTLYP